MMYAEHYQEHYGIGKYSVQWQVLQFQIDVGSEKTPALKNTKYLYKSENQKFIIYIFIQLHIWNKVYIKKVLHTL